MPGIGLQLSGGDALQMIAEIVMKAMQTAGGTLEKVVTRLGAPLETPTSGFYIASVTQQPGLLITQLHASPLSLFQEHSSSKDNSNSVSDAIDLLWKSIYLANRGWKNEFAS